jgi:nitroreductase
MAPFIDLVRSRRSIRRFLPDPVPREKILACLEAARLAPSAENAQPCRYLVVDDAKLIERVSKAAFSGIYSMTRFAAQAPVIVVVLARLGLKTHRLGSMIQGTSFHLIDAGIAVEHFVLQAEELGLATCWVGWFSSGGLRKALDIPGAFRIVSILPVGYAASRPPGETVRKPLSEIAWFNRIGDAGVEAEGPADPGTRGR